MKVKTLGFTGTRDGTTPCQRDALRRLLLELDPAEVHHGLCLGADEDFARVCHALWGMAVTQKGHPCDLERWRSDDACAFCEEVFQPAPPLDRNRRIVERTEALVACPGGFEEERRSGTWATIRAARKLGRPVAIIWPDGRVERERWPADAPVAPSGGPVQRELFQGEGT